jgi:hypothetical protein
MTAVGRSPFSEAIGSVPSKRGNQTSVARPAKTQAIDEAIREFEISML